MALVFLWNFYLLKKTYDSRHYKAVLVFAIDCNFTNQEKKIKGFKFHWFSFLLIHVKIKFHIKFKQVIGVFDLQSTRFLNYRENIFHRLKHFLAILSPLRRKQSIVTSKYIQDLHQRLEFEN